MAVCKGEANGEQKYKEIGNEREASNECLFRISWEAPPHINEATSNKQ